MRCAPAAGRCSLLAAALLLWLLAGGMAGIAALGTDRPQEAASAGWASGTTGGIQGGPSYPAATAHVVSEPGGRYALADDPALTDFAPGDDGLVRAIVVLSGDGRAGPRLAAALGVAARVDHNYRRLIHGLALRLLPDALPALRAQPDVLAVYPDVEVGAALADSVPLVGAPQVWALADPLGRPAIGTGVRIAVLDTGVDYTHPALGGCLGPGCRVAGGHDFVDDDDDPRDGNGHGTHVAGIAAADGLLQGVAPGAELLAYRVLDDNGVGYASDVIAALERAVADGAGVINLSLAGPGTPTDPLAVAAGAAVDAGCVVVAAAGNRGPRPGSIQSPGLAPAVLAVAASDKADVVAGFSGRGPVPGSYALKPDLTAPGVDISSTVPLSTPFGDPGGWLAASGTSMAAPHVAGGAALLRQLHPTWSPREVGAALLNNARDLGAGLFEQGAGRLDLAPAAQPALLAVPGSLSFGLPLLDGTRSLTVTVRSLATTTLSLSPALALAQVADGTGQPLSPTVPVGYAAVSPAALALAPGESAVLTVSLGIPPDAADGHYHGHLQVGAARVPFGFSLLSRVTVRVLDENGAEIEGWGHMAVLARVPQADVVVSNVPLQLPATFTVPSGSYHVQAFGRFGLYDSWLIPGFPQQVPYALIRPAEIAPHSWQTVTLSVGDARTYWLAAADTRGDPGFINAWAASFHYRQGEASWLTRLGQSSVRVLSTYLPDEWPAGFPLRLSDTPAGVAFSLELQRAALTPRYRDFVLRHDDAWPADPDGRMGMPLVGAADRSELVAWELPALDAFTPTSFTLDVELLATYTARTDLPTVSAGPWLDWEPAGEAWLYLPTGAGSGLEPAAPGLTRTLGVAGAHAAVYAAGPDAGRSYFVHPFYTPDWSQVYAWDEDPAVSVPAEWALRPAPAADGGELALGAGPLYPALAFANRPDAIRLRHPLLAGASGTPVVCAADPGYSLAFRGQPLAAGSLPEHDLLPAPQRAWSDLAPGSYTLTITSTPGLPGQSACVLRAGLTLTTTSGADLDPPQLLELELEQRYDPAAALTATWAFSDAGPLAVQAALEPSGVPVPVEPLGGGRFLARLEPAGALTLSLAYTATDAAGNWLAARSVTLAERPVTLAFEIEPARVPWGEQPVKVRLRGSLLGPGGQPLSAAPSWLRLRAGGRFVGYARDLTGSAGSYRTGAIDFAWTFIPAELAGGPGCLPVSLELDVGLSARQVVTRTLTLVPRAYLPLVWKGGQM